jgi:hypothetical protein
VVSFTELQGQNIPSPILALVGSTRRLEGRMASDSSIVRDRIRWPLELVASCSSEASMAFTNGDRDFEALGIFFVKSFQNACLL